METRVNSLFQRIIAAVLCAVMLMTVLPAPAAATQTADETVETVASTDETEGAAKEAAEPEWILPVCDCGSTEPEIGSRGETCVRKVFLEEFCKETEDPTKETGDPTKETEGSTDETEAVEETEPEDAIFGINRNGKTPLAVVYAASDFQPDGDEFDDAKIVIHYIDGYAGMYMEDGTNEPVADVMMIILENTSEQDLQLARISIEYEVFAAQFEVTNLPSGEKVVALEKNRHPEASGDYLSIQTKNVVFFQKKMGLQEERIQIKGANGTLEVTNISGEDIAGDIYVYYKNSARDLLYGGITYRVAVRGGLKAGESTRVIAGHYTPDNCRILQVDCGD